MWYNIIIVQYHIINDFVQKAFFNYLEFDC